MRGLNGISCEKSIGRRKAVPVLYVQGTHYEVGFDIGRTFSSIIKNFIATYDNLRSFEKEYKTDAGRKAYDKTLANMKKRFPYYVKEIQGVADGANVPFLQLFLLQMDDLIDTVNDNHIPRNDTGGCSSIAFKNPQAVNPRGTVSLKVCAFTAKKDPFVMAPRFQGVTLLVSESIGILGVEISDKVQYGSHLEDKTKLASKKTILGHTEDAFSETLNHFYIMSAHITPSPEDREHGAVEERFASLCYAGSMPGYTMGYNENGLVFSINTLSPMMLKHGNTPRTFLTRAMLASKNFAEAESILRDEGLGIGNGFSVNMIWTNSWGDRQIYNVEVAPDLKADSSQLNIQKYDKEVLVHCNKYLRSKVPEVNGRIIDSSVARLHTIHSHASPRSRQDVAAILSDTSGDEFQLFQEKPDDVIKTIAAGIFDLDKRTWSIYINQPKSSEPVAVLPITFTSLDY